MAGGYRKDLYTTYVAYQPSEDGMTLSPPPLTLRHVPEMISSLFGVDPLPDIPIIHVKFGVLYMSMENLVQRKFKNIFVEENALSQGTTVYVDKRSFQHSWREFFICDEQHSHIRPSISSMLISVGLVGPANGWIVSNTQLKNAWVILSENTFKNTQ